MVSYGPKIIFECYKKAKTLEEVVVDGKTEKKEHEIALRYEFSVINNSPYSLIYEALDEIKEAVQKVEKENKAQEDKANEALDKEIEPYSNEQ